jgi:O-antigen/teichoic acid export membrane protein
MHRTDEAGCGPVGGQTLDGRERMPTSSRIRFLKGFTATALNQAVMIAIQLALVPLLATHWGLPQYGSWLMMTTIPTYLSLSDFGFATAAGTDMAIKVARNDTDGANTAFATAWLLILATTGLLSLAGVMSMFLSPDQWLGRSGGIGAQEIRQTISLLILYSVFCVHMSVFAAALRADRQFAVSMTIYAGTFFFEGLFGGIGVLFGGSTTALAAIYCVIRFAGILAMWIGARALLPWLRVGFRGVRRRDMAALARPSFAALAMPLAQSLSLQGAVLAVGMGAGPAQVALFSTVRTATRVGLQLSTLFTNPLLPEYSAAYGRKDRTAQLCIVGIAVLSSLLVILPAGLVLAAFGPQLVGAWTNWTILATKELILPLALAMSLQALWIPAASMIAAMNRQARFTYRYLLSALLFLPVTYVLASIMGATGGALSALAAEGLMLWIVRGTVAAEIGPTMEIAHATYGWMKRALRSEQKTPV